MELQKELLGTARYFTTEQALEPDRTFEASIAHIRQLAEAQGTHVKAMRTLPIRKCHTCGGNHQNDTLDQCPAYGTIFNNCDKPNHWGKLSRLIKQRRSKSRDRQQKRQFRSQHQSMTRQLITFPYLSMSRRILLSDSSWDVCVQWKRLHQCLQREGGRWGV